MATVDSALLLKVKNHLRISHNALDDDLADAIRAALRDLQICGVTEPAQADPQDVDPLILNAVKLYCRKEFTDDTTKAADYQRRYDALKTCLMLSSRYKGAAVNE